MTSKELKGIRKELGLTQLQFGEKLGVSMRTIQSWEYDKTKIPVPMQSLIRNLQEKNTEISNDAINPEEILNTIEGEQILTYMLKNIDKFRNLSMIKAVVEIFCTLEQNKAMKKVYTELQEIKQLKEELTKLNKK